MADKLAIITGASSGIGLELANRGKRRLRPARSWPTKPPSRPRRANCAVMGITVEAVQADLSTIEGVDRLLAAARRAAGRPALCANAGHGLGHDFLDQEVAEWRHVIDTNVTGTLYLLQNVLKDMVARNDGKVLITGSIAGFMPGSFQAVYNGTKAFIDSFADALRNELKEKKASPSPP
jgi:short-subunit dehydrogenase